MTTDGAHAETKGALTGYDLLDAAELDEAVAIAARLPAAWNGAVEVRPVIHGQYHWLYCWYGQGYGVVSAGSARCSR